MPAHVQISPIDAAAFQVSAKCVTLKSNPETIRQVLACEGLTQSSDGQIFHHDECGSEIFRNQMPFRQACESCNRSGIKSFTEVPRRP
jgi:hypothetical protein